MTQLISGAIGAVVLAVVLIVLEALRTRKPRIHDLCCKKIQDEVNFKLEFPEALSCQLQEGHSGVHGCKRGKLRIWWEKEQ